MEVRSIETFVDLNCDQEAAFAALITPSAIRHWWNADRAIVDARVDGFWMAAWGEHEDRPEYVCGYDISVFSPPFALEFSRPRYTAQTGELPFDTSGITVNFEVRESEGGCRLTVRQDGFPGDGSADDFCQGCEQGWRETLSELKRWLE